MKKAADGAAMATETRAEVKVLFYGPGAGAQRRR